MSTPAQAGTAPTPGAVAGARLPATTKADIPDALRAASLAVEHTDD